MRSFLVNFCGGFIYSTAPAPAAIGAAEAALDLIQQGELDLPGYHATVQRAHDLLREAGFDTAPSSSQIIPIQLGSEEKAVSCAAFLSERGILAVPIRPPTVPPGSSRLRISIGRLHSEDHLDELVSALLEWRAKEGG
jgi:8-amino-7-oxononanoate synthase